MAKSNVPSRKTNADHPQHRITTLLGYAATNGDVVG